MIRGNKFESNKKLISRREFLAGGGAVIAAIALTACGPKTTNSTTNIPTSVTSTPLKQTSISPSTPTLTPKYGGTLRYLTGQLTNHLGWPADVQTSMRYLTAKL